jgi:hypothetical protein
VVCSTVSLSPESIGLTTNNKRDAINPTADRRTSIFLGVLQSVISDTIHKMADKASIIINRFNEDITLCFTNLKKTSVR